MLTSEKKNAYLSILSEELVPATGCTEPIALAYAAARLRDILGVWPEKIRAEVSGNIIKNVKSVVVPNSGGLKGMTRGGSCKSFPMSRRSGTKPSRPILRILLLRLPAPILPGCWTSG